VSQQSHLTPGHRGVLRDAARQTTTHIDQFITAVLFNLIFRTTGFSSSKLGFESFEKTMIYRTSVYNPIANIFFKKYC